MLLKRLGNKTKLAKQIQQYFPKHNTYIEPFFGAGGMFFNKPKVKYNYLNDFDNDVYNLYNVLMNNKDELLYQIKMMPIHNKLWNYSKKNQEENNVKKAVRFLLLSNFGYFGNTVSLRYCNSDMKSQLLKQIDETYNYITNHTIFNNCDFEKFIKSYSFRKQSEINNTFVYCDPPYLNTADNYSNSFKEEDLHRLIRTLNNKGVKYAISEFLSPKSEEIAKEYNLRIIKIKERVALKSIKTEIIMINYDPPTEINNTFI